MPIHPYHPPSGINDFAQGSDAANNANNSIERGYQILKADIPSPDTPEGSLLTPAERARREVLALLLALIRAFPSADRRDKSDLVLRRRVEVSADLSCFNRRRGETEESAPELRIVDDGHWMPLRGAFRLDLLVSASDPMVAQWEAERRPTADLTSIMRLFIQLSPPGALVEGTDSCRLELDRLVQSNCAVWAANYHALDLWNPDAPLHSAFSELDVHSFVFDDAYAYYMIMRTPDLLQPGQRQMPQMWLSARFHWKENEEHRRGLITQLLVRTHKQWNLIQERRRVNVRPLYAGPWFDWVYIMRPNYPHCT